MRASCLINNYNYGDYVVEAVESALAQTRPFDEIIVVDDGSTDRSRALLQQHYANHPVVKLIFKENGGQLSTVNVGFQHSTGDVIFFLDSDDLYAPNYLESVIPLYKNTGAGFIFSAHRKFGAYEKVVDAGADVDYGVTRLLTYFLRKRGGGPTSCLSARRSVLAAFLPIPFESDWRSCADDCILYGAALVGARKAKHGRPLVLYRRHERNYTVTRRTPEQLLRYSVAIERLLNHLCSRENVDMDRLAHLAYLEFLTKPEPSFQELRYYARILLGTKVFSTAHKLRYVLRMAAHFRNAGKKSRSRASLDYLQDQSKA